MMSSDNDTSDVSAGSHGDVHKNSTDQGSVMSGSDGLVPSDGSHMGSVSVDSIDSDSLTDPLADGFVDQSQQVRGGGGLNLAVETEILGSEVGTDTEDPIINSIADCKMKPSTNLYYRVKDLHFDNVVIFLIKWHELYLTNKDLNNMRNLSKMYCEMIDNVLRLRHMNFSALKLPRFDYADQTKISKERVDLATACAIHYGLHTGMVIQYLKGEYVGESRDAN